MDKKSVKPLEELLDSVRDIDGFPIGEDEDILALSDPPFYTACPNPYIEEFIEEYGTHYDPENDDYKRKPFIANVSEGKNSSIYNAFSYHTKVPHKAIIPFIEHYTEPGDIVFDGFCGSGMTGVAAQMSNRKAILSDISTVASFIAYNYNNPVHPKEFEKKANEIIKAVEKECGWMYETYHRGFDSKSNGIFSDDKSYQKGVINYTVWSDVLICPYCNAEYVFWDAAVIKETKKVKSDYLCPECDAKITKKSSKRAFEEFFDNSLRKKISQAKQVPVLINYKLGKKKFEKVPDKHDLNILKKINEMEIPFWYPTNELPNGFNTEQPKRSHGITNIHHFYTKRNLWVLSSIWEKIKDTNLKIMLLILLVNNSRMSRYGSRTGNVSGTLYVPSMMKELNVLEYLKRKLKGQRGILNPLKSLNKCLTENSSISINSITMLKLKDNSVDYIFTDPPFGSNLMYSELNLITESWLKVFTNNNKEAIINKTQNKALNEYTELMTQSFKEMYRILKPKRWITIVFHNSKASVWNSIQESVNRAGFIIEQVTTLDKQQGSFKQVTSAGAVKNDLIINAYKPKEEFSRRFIANAGENMEIDFITEILEHLPIRPNIGRTEQMLYSKTLAHYVENGFKIRFNSTNFHQLLSDNLTELDGYWFTDSQVKEYNEWKSGLSLDQLKEVLDGQQVLVVTDEKSALTWIYNFLNKPKDFSEILSAFNPISQKSDDVIPELREILDNNFIIENGKYRRPLNQQEKEEINKNREKELDRAFEKLLNQAKTQKGKIKNIRREALVHGFTKCYQEGRYQDILTIADKLYASTLESSGEIMDFIDIARIKTSGEE
ncbi:MAG: DNA methyltransferase [Methanobacterium sp.]|nr:DNA methyltransferase [Methanobacterium sp.]